MLPVLALVAAASAWEGFATGVGLGLTVYKASKIKLQCYISILERKKVIVCIHLQDLPQHSLPVHCQKINVSLMYFVV